jgi:hypothetical protein
MQLLHNCAPSDHNDDVLDSWDAFKGLRQFHLDVSTRWNSTFDMLQSLAQMRKPLDIMRSHEASNANTKHQFLTDQQWDTIFALLDVLQPFKDTTEDISGQEYPTLGYAFVAFDALVQHCQDIYEESPSPLIKNLASTLKANVETRLRNLRQTNGAIGDMSMVVDPRFRLHYIHDASRKVQVRQQLINQLTSLEPAVEPQADTAENRAAKRRCLKRGSLMRSLDKSSVTSDKSETVEQEVDRWLGKGCMKFDTNVYNWFQQNKQSFPRIAKAALCFLPIQASSVASERTFSWGGQLVTSMRHTLNDTTLQALVCLKSWLTNEEALTKAVDSIVAEE